MSESRVYRTEQGTVFRINEDDEGRISVELLGEADVWVAGPIGMAGLRIAPTTRQLTDRQVRSLPG